MTDASVLTAIGDALNSLVERVEALEERLDSKSERVTAIPGKFPWSKTHPAWPGVRISQPLELVES